MNIKLLESMTTPYLFLSALRGPDNNSQKYAAVKRLVTERLRGIFFERIECLGNWTSVPMSPDEFHDFVVAITKLRATDEQKWGHFVHHLRDAVRQVQSHEIWGGYGMHVWRILDSCVFTDNSFKLATESIIKEVEDGEQGT